MSKQGIIYKTSSILLPILLIASIALPVMVAVSSHPVQAQTQTNTGNTTLEQILTKVQRFLNQIIGFLFVLATLIFLWGLVKFIASADNPDERKKARGLMMWGIVGLALMVAVWGVVNVLVNFFNVGSGNIPQGVGKLN